MVPFTNDHGERDYHLPIAGTDPVTVPRWWWLLLLLAFVAGFLLGAPH
jgi:hypothetical protein